ncbi:MAG: glycogen synthase [Verrucomicrobiae bacterium]|nr:glycogen synthase [Verrucomicrobiae bacterium]
MKVLFLTNEYPPNIYGGAGVHVDYLTRQLARLMDVDVRCFGKQENLLPHLAIKGYGLDECLDARMDKKMAGAIQALSRCLRFNATPIDAQIVHCHTWYSHFGGVLAKMLNGIPLVITTHSLEPLRPWKREQLGTGYDLSCWIEKTAMEMADRIIAVSQGMKEDILRLFKVDPSKIEVIYNGIDIDEYRKVSTQNCFPRFGIDPQKPYVLFVGRITRQKGIVHLVRAIQHLHPALQVVLCAGAPDTREIAAEMQNHVQSIQKQRPGVIWIQEMVDRPTAIELYSNAAVFCCPSIYEPFGIINLEAMSCGTPVVASAVGGIKEVVLHEKTGLLTPLDQYQESPFEPRDPARFSRDLADGINRLMGDDALRRKMSKASRERVEAIFSWQSIAKQTFELYQKLSAHP